MHTTKSPPKPTFRSCYFTVTNEGTIEHKVLRIGGHTIYAPVKLKRGDRGLLTDENKQGCPPIPVKSGGKFVFMLPGGYEFIDDKEGVL